MNPDRRTCLCHHNVSFDKKKLHPISPLVALCIYLLKLGISFQVVYLHLLATSDILKCDVYERGSNTRSSVGLHFRNHITSRHMVHARLITAKVTAKAVKFCLSFQDTCITQWI